MKMIRISNAANLSTAVRRASNLTNKLSQDQDSITTFPILKVILKCPQNVVFCSLIFSQQNMMALNVLHDI